MNINGPIHVSEVPATQPAMPPTHSLRAEYARARLTADQPDLEPNPARALQNVFEASDKWELNAWTESALIMASAALKHMLVKVERELGKRKHITPRRTT